MHTMIIIDSRPDMDKFTVLKLKDKISSKKETSLYYKYGDIYPSAAWYVIAGSLTRVGAVYRYEYGSLSEPWQQFATKTASGYQTIYDFSSSESVDSENKALYHGIMSGIALSEVISNDLSQLDSRYGAVYVIHAPAIQSGRLFYRIGEDLAPVLVQMNVSIGKDTDIKQKQKHVSKPHTPK